jgi:predicted HTH transcriptional regulator
MPIRAAVDVSDEEVLSYLVQTEDNFVERKLFSDSSEWLDTAVAFANSCPIGSAGVMFIGVLDDGTPEQRTPDLNSVQESLDRKIQKGYPRIEYRTRILRKNGLSFLAVIVPGSKQRPHFAGPSCIRVGAKNVKTSETQLAELVAQRSGKTYEILPWVGKTITVERLREAPNDLVGRVAGYFEPTLQACTAQAVTFSTSGNAETVPLEDVKVSFDHTRNRLKLLVPPSI